MDGVKVVFLAEDRVRILANEVKQNSSLRFLGMIERVQQVIVIAPAGGDPCIVGKFGQEAFHRGGQAEVVSGVWSMSRRRKFVKLSRCNRAMQTSSSPAAWFGLTLRKKAM